MASNELKSIEWTNGKVVFINQISLPLKLDFITTEDYRVVIHAIKTLQIRGAPLIGIAAAYAAVLGAGEGAGLENDRFQDWMSGVLHEIESARPTAKNLFLLSRKFV